MAANEVFSGYKYSVVCSDPATPTSGSPVRFGTLTGVAVTDEGGGGNTTGETTVDFGATTYTLSVKGVDDSGNSAVAVGDSIFYVDADTPKLSKKSSGYFFGVALETVGSGSTASIKVMHIPSPGSGTLGSGTVGTTNLATSAVTAAKLSSTLKTGYIPLALTSARVIATNDIPNSGSADGGVISKDTAPKLERVNGATDKCLRVAWAASSSVEIQLPSFAYPPDLDDTAAVTVKLLAKMGGATDTPTIAVGYFEGIGDSNAGGNTGALSSSIQTLSVAIAAADVGTAPNVAAITLTPGAHTTDALHLIAAWVEYTRK